VSLQAFLARLYVDPDFRRDFFAAPRLFAARAGLSPDDVASVETMNRDEVELAAASFRNKREGARPPQKSAPPQKN
jgi:hypothetical protein